MVWSLSHSTQLLTFTQPATLVTILPQDGFEFSGATSDYASIIGEDGLPVDYIIATTGGDGAAQIQIKAGPIMYQAKEVVLSMEDRTEK